MESIKDIFVGPAGLRLGASRSVPPGQKVATIILHDVPMADSSGQPVDETYQCTAQMIKDGLALRHFEEREHVPDVAAPIPGEASASPVGGTGSASNVDHLDE